ncbi:MAG: 2Fe-2S iron-sulfur cluster binding domain-containing protein [Gammaproteobacteria bacterium]|nr:2Fe-2S iron-sulfur cluster binding domain-containing protein [Gammaproteobacteria bacterium]
MKLTVNEQCRTSHAQEQTPLLYVLRNELNLKGTRFGCGEGHCGACMVLVDDRLTRSCDTPLSEVQGKKIRTVESLLEQKTHPIVKAISKHRAWQCGYCIAGIVMHATALYESETPYDRAEIAAALDDNFCRCGAHPRILDALVEALSQRS